MEPREKKASLVKLAIKEHLVKEEEMVIVENLVSKVPEDHRDWLVHQVHPDHVEDKENVEHPATTDLVEQMEFQDHQEKEDLQANKDHPDLQVVLEHQEGRDQAADWD